jgi:poly(3-hydroxyalkanoate) depolymerase
MSPLAPNRVRVLTIMGTRVRVSVRGTGTPLLLIMGIGGSLDMWQPLERSLTPLGYQTISFDLPGSGASPAVFPPRRMPGLACIALGVLEALDIEQADLLGVSFGGIVAQEVARLDDTRVRRVVLAATGPGLGGIPAHPVVLAHMSTPLRYWSPRYAQRIGPSIYGGAARRDDGLHERMSARFERPPSLLGYAGQLYAISWWTSLPWLHRVRKPVLVLHGDDDPIAPLANARLLARLLPDARLVVLEGSGHLFLLDEPELAARHVDDFLKR